MAVRRLEPWTFSLSGCRRYVPDSGFDVVTWAYARSSRFSYFAVSASQHCRRGGRRRWPSGFRLPGRLVLPAHHDGRSTEGGSTGRQPSVFCALGGALGGTRTPILLIRRSGRVIQGCPSRSVHGTDAPGSSICGNRSLQSWQQFWQQSWVAVGGPPMDGERTD